MFKRILGCAVIVCALAFGADGEAGDGSDPVNLADYINAQFDPSLSWADETGYSTEPERAAKVNLALSYTSSDGTRAASAFYGVRTRRNDERSFVGADGAAVTQDTRGSLQQLGAAGSIMPAGMTLPGKASR